MRNFRRRVGPSCQIEALFLRGGYLSLGGFDFYYDGRLALGNNWYCLSASSTPTSFSDMGGRYLVIASGTMRYDPPFGLGGKPLAI